MESLGKTGEDLVTVHYKSLGYTILERNFIQHFGKQMGEIDLIASKDQEIVFVEVKTRASNRFGTSFEAIDNSKKRKLVNMVKLYLNLHSQYAGFNPRIDVAAVDIDNTQQPVIILANAIEDLS